MADYDAIVAGGGPNGLAAAIRLAEAPSHGVPISAYDPSSPGALAYRELAAELLAGDGVAAPVPVQAEVAS